MLHKKIVLSISRLFFGCSMHACIIFLHFNSPRCFRMMIWWWLLYIMFCEYSYTVVSVAVTIQIMVISRNYEIAGFFVEKFNLYLKLYNQCRWSLSCKFKNRLETNRNNENKSLNKFRIFEQPTKHNNLTMQQTNWNKIATQVNHNDKKICKKKLWIDF